MEVQAANVEELAASQASAVRVVFADTDELGEVLAALDGAMASRPAAPIEVLELVDLDELERECVDEPDCAPLKAVVARVAGRIDLTGCARPRKREPHPLLRRALEAGLLDGPTPRELVLENCFLDDEYAPMLAAWLRRATAERPRLLSAPGNLFEAEGLLQLVEALHARVGCAEADLTRNKGSDDAEVRSQLEKLADRVEARRAQAPAQAESAPAHQLLDDESDPRAFVQFIKVTLPSWKSLSDAERILLVQHSGTLGKKPGQVLLNDLADRTAANGALRDKVIARLEGAADVAACQHIIAQTLEEELGAEAACAYREEHGLGDGRCAPSLSKHSTQLDAHPRPMPHPPRTQSVAGCSERRGARRCRGRGT